MITRVYLPQFELTMESAVVVGWLVKEGDPVGAGQKLVEIETQKAISDVLSPVAGVVRRICATERETIPSKTLLCLLSTRADEPLEADQAPPASPDDSSPPRLQAGPSSGAGAPESVETGGIRASPAARKAARELGIELRLVAGTGPAGRIGVEDVKAFAALPEAGSAGNGWTPIPSPRLALILEMGKALAEIPQIVIARQIEVTPLVKKAEGITFTHRLILSAAAALGRHPSLRTITDGQRNKLLPTGVAVAIDTPAGLIAPVLRGEELRSVETISRRLTELRERASRRELKNDELKDGPFAITNLGMLGVDFFTPSIFHGQTAVLAVGRAAATAGGTAAWFCLAADHRVVDGAEAARFLATLQREILSPRGSGLR